MLITRAPRPLAGRRDATLALAPWPIPLGRSFTTPALDATWPLMAMVPVALALPSRAYGVTMRPAASLDVPTSPCSVPVDLGPRVELEDVPVRRPLRARVGLTRVGPGPSIDALRPVPLVRP